MLPSVKYDEIALNFNICKFWKLFLNLANRPPGRLARLANSFGSLGSPAASKAAPGSPGAGSAEKAAPGDLKLERLLPERLVGRETETAGKISKNGRQKWQNYQIVENFANFWRARSRLYQSEILQENMRFTAFFKIYQILKLKFLKFDKILQILRHLQFFC